MSTSPHAGGAGDRPATRVARAVLQAGEEEALTPSPVFAGTYRHQGDPAGATYTYGRYANPTWTAYEDAVGALEGGPALVFASGMAAATAVLAVALAPGDTLVLPADGYYTLRAHAEEYLAPRGVTVRSVPTRTDALSEAAVGARLVWVETPANPGLNVCDIRAVASAARSAGALLAVDNTTATVRAQRPLDLGADYSVSSDTKATTGHADLVLGHVATRDASLLDPLATWRTRGGAVAGPMETWLALRGLATLDLRLVRQCGTALRVAAALRDHPRVLACRYPGLPDDPAYDEASRQMDLFGQVVGVTLPSAAAAEAWLDQARLVTPATSFGGIHTTAERRARWGGDDVPAGFVRLSLGIEDPDDLLDDILGSIP